MLATAAILGTGAVAVGAASAVTAGAGAYFYKRKQKRKEKKKKAQKEQIVFGQHLEEITNLSENDLPIVFDFTVSWLENNGLAVDSLFVTTRNPMRAGELARMFDSQSDEEPTFDGEDPRDVSLLLVRYLTDLPEPLCTFVLYDDFVQIEQESNVEEWIEAMRSELLQLPDINLRVIKRLLSFLQLYASEQQRVCSVPTERTIDSLSKIFGRILFNTWDTDSSAFEDQKIAENLFTKLIINYERVFGSSHPMFSPLAQESKVQSISTNNFISLEKEPTTEKSSSPRGTPEKRKKEKRKKKKKRSSQQDKSDMDDMSSPDLGAMCGEAQSEVGISLDKKPLPQIPR